MSVVKGYSTYLSQAFGPQKAMVLTLGIQTNRAGLEKGSRGDEATREPEVGVMAYALGNLFQ
ncbi:MAG: hypothetical protein RMX26_05255 [Planktomarina sp.]|nr:hypothetical protein [Planktomarina sp.]|tara:strand:+ start:3556 stop:3741 length:186 start_codon:yes stop_codon:yes gene_type:complete